MDKSVAELIRISRVVGSDVKLVQGGGGNTSVKTDDGKRMVIKASGTTLSNMSRTEGWRRVEIRRALDMLDDKKLAGLDANARETEVVNRLMLSCDDGVTGGARPSVETPLHAMLGKVVIHLHPWAIGAYVNARGGRERLEKLFRDEKQPPLWVPYVDPGFTLARALARLVNNYVSQFGRKPAIVFLERHGLIVSADTSDAALRLVRKVNKVCEGRLTPVKHAKVRSVDADVVFSAQLALRKAFFDVTGRYVSVRHYVDGMIAGFANRAGSKALLNPAGLTPDELVYAGGAPVWLDRCEVGTISTKIRKRVDQGQKPPAAFFVKNVGLFVVGDDKKAPIVRDIAVGSMVIRSAAARMGGVFALGKRHRDFINNWESETFREKVLGAAAAGELKDRIAVVTGGGSGLGRAIAIGLARAGAAVAVGDIDTSAAAETCEMIRDELPGGAAMVAECNVTDEKSVDGAFATLLNRWGGLDIVVNAAGVAPAYPLVDFPVDKWRFALEINLTGYFLMARAAARVMIEQGIGGNIVNISSKSGLEASGNNSAYNATKAGELHMARGWARDLGPNGIRVNCVCPGNVFEGSKIWNPVYFRECAKKYGIKPEEVIPFYLDKTALKRDIKGQDIADSVVFLCSDRSRTITGQVIVADSGQVTVR